MCLLFAVNMLIAILFLIALIALIGIVDILAPKIRFIRGHVNIIRLLISDLIVLGIGWCLLSGLSPTMPVEKINEEMRAEQLFVNVRQDSLKHLMDKKNMKFKTAGIFSSKATLQFPITSGSTSATRNLTAELNSLASSFGKKLQVELIADTDVKLQCPTIKQDGITYVTVPAVVMVNLMEQDYALKIEDSLKPQPSRNRNKR